MLHVAVALVSSFLLFAQAPARAEVYSGSKIKSPEAIPSQTKAAPPGQIKKDTSAPDREPERKALPTPSKGNRIPAAAKVVRDEVLRSQQDRTGRPLPLVAHWHRWTLPLSYQLQLIREGHAVLPWIDYSRHWRELRMQPEDVEAMKTLREWNLPLVLITGGQWEADFYLNDDYKGLPVEETGLAINLDGSRMNKISPFSPVEPWRLLGRKWTDNPIAEELQALYPDPPRVLFVSNNEAKDLRWTEAETAKDYVDLFGMERDGEFKRKVFGDGWIERYSALLGGMREGLAESAWRTNSRFAGYNSFAPDHWGRFGGWKAYSLQTEDRISPDWYTWQGGIKDAYDNHWEGGKTAFNVWSMQAEMMNQVFMKDEAFAVQPEFWFELVFWDGNRPGKADDKYAQYKEQGVDYTPDLYSGWVQYGLWLLTPRVAREWRASDDPAERWWPYFEQVIIAVDRVHADPVLTKFWRHGKLVANSDRPHPFRFGIPQKWQNAPRMYHLDTNLDPAYPWKLDQRVPVWTLARVIGEKPKREWLVYAHAPLGEQQNVSVRIPDYKTTVLPQVAVGGSFYHITEQ